MMEEEELKIEFETMEEWRAGSLQGAERGGSGSLEWSGSGRSKKNVWR